MRFRVLAAVGFAVCGALPLLAKASPPTPPAAPTPPHTRAKATPPAPAAPQAIFDATGLGSPLQLKSDWRVGITSDPAASSPTFDDSNWAVRNAQADINDVPDVENETSASPAKTSSGATANPATNPDAQRYAWFRLHIKLAPNHGPLALLIEPLSPPTHPSVSAPPAPAPISTPTGPTFSLRARTATLRNTINSSHASIT